MEKRLSEIRIYPVKSLAGFSRTECTLTPQGLEDDRRWMVVDASGRFLSQRTFPDMCFLEAYIEHNGLRIHDRKGRLHDLVLSAEEARTGFLQQVQIWDDVVEALCIDKQEAGAWFSKLLGFPCTLVYMPESTRRQVDHKYAQPGDVVSFADGYPVLFALEASLTDLNSRGLGHIEMLRFRPNLIISGGTAWEEDSWRHIRVGDAAFRTPKPCARCQMITVDPHTAHVGQEPMRTLATFRTSGNKVLFGMNACWEQSSATAIRVGDQVL